MQNNNIEFKDYIPEEEIKNYFSIIEKDKDVSVCLLASADGVGSSVYIETAADNEYVEGVIKVFLNATDIRRYGKTVAIDEHVENDKVRKWEMPYSAFLSYIKEINEKRLAKNQKGIKAVATIILNNKLVDIDVIYTPEKNFSN